MNVVKDIIEDIGVRLGNDRLKLPEDEPKVRRCLNRIYKRLNNRYKLIQRSALLDFSTLSTGTTWMPIPDDLIEIYWIDPPMTYVQPNIMWSNTYQAGIFTIEESLIKFSSEIDRNSQFNIRYYSTGRTLVNKEDSLVVTTSETNTPEWRSAFYEVLLYATCLEMEPEYKRAKEDAYLLDSLLKMMATDTWSSQNTTPTIIGGNFGSGDTMFDGGPADPFIGQQ